MSMEKKRMRPVKSGRSLGMSYSRQKEVFGYARNLIEVHEQILMNGSLVMD